MRVGTPPVIALAALDAALAPFDVEPLRETARIATELRQRLGL